MRRPTMYLPHGGGPCFFMEWTMGPADTWDRMAEFLRGLPASLPEAPKSLLVVSAHWEEKVPTVMTGTAPPLLFDYGGFPKHTYELTWPAPGVGAGRWGMGAWMAEVGAGAEAVGSTLVVEHAWRVLRRAAARTAGRACRRGSRRWSLRSSRCRATDDERDTRCRSRARYGDVGVLWC